MQIKDEKQKMKQPADVLSSVTFNQQIYARSITDSSVYGMLKSNNFKSCKIYLVQGIYGRL